MPFFSGNLPSFDHFSRIGIARNVASYTGAISACAKAGDGNAAMEWLRKMEEDGISPEASTTLVSLSVAFFIHDEKENVVHSWLSVFSLGSAVRVQPARSCFIVVA